jgi:outer membrane receptor for ferrienterochelin and colicins
MIPCIRSFTFSIALILAIQGFAQTGMISGKVTMNGSPVEYINVAISGTDMGSVSGEDGLFEIRNVPFGSLVVTASGVGYESQHRQVSLSTNNPTVVLNFDLHESVAELQEVVISGTMKEVSKLESPVPVEVYTPAFFKANPVPSLFESLQNINGVRPQLNCNICNTGDIHINGLEGPYTMILIDGMPIVSGLSTVYGLTGIPQALIERMEVVKGAASSITGMPCLAAIVLMASISAHWPYSETGIIALVRGVMAASSSCGSRL